MRELRLGVEPLAVREALHGRVVDGLLGREHRGPLDGVGALHVHAHPAGLRTRLRRLLRSVLSAGKERDIRQGF